MSKNIEAEIKDLIRVSNKAYNAGWTFGDVIRNVITWAFEHPQNPWRSVKDELPKNGDQVIFMCSRRRPVRVYYGWYREFHDGSRSFMTIDPNATTWTIGRVTHWMPFQQLPKGGKK